MKKFNDYKLTKKFLKECLEKPMVCNYYVDEKINRLVHFAYNKLDLCGLTKKEKNQEVINFIYSHLSEYDDIEHGVAEVNDYLENNIF